MINSIRLIQTVTRRTVVLEEGWK